MPKRRAQRRGDQSGAGSGADERELAQVKRVNTRAPGPWPITRVHAKIFHRGIEHLFDRRLQAVNFVEEETSFFSSEVRMAVR